jgi:SpoVK/Ycf46/Vps4 family AAA+-type ATPase
MPKSKVGKQGKLSKRTEWTWDKNYRVWDANRKIFLYPKNWIEPELRSPVRLRETLDKVAAFVRERCDARKPSGRISKPERRSGVRVLFAGPSGTGKTMAAGVLAAELKKDLFRIDLGVVVSKYIGETEKNLTRVFNAAKDSGAILFFDEADALFGKRTEVKDSHDRYANIEINYFLQRIEHYGDLSILAADSRIKIDNVLWPGFHLVISIPPRGT